MSDIAELDNNIYNLIKLYEMEATEFNNEIKKKIEEHFSNNPDREDIGRLAEKRDTLKEAELQKSMTPEYMQRIKATGAELSMLECDLSKQIKEIDRMKARQKVCEDEIRKTKKQKQMLENNETEEIVQMNQHIQEKIEAMQKPCIDMVEKRRTDKQRPLDEALGLEIDRYRTMDMDKLDKKVVRLSKNGVTVFVERRQTTLTKKSKIFQMVCEGRGLESEKLWNDMHPHNLRIITDGGLLFSTDNKFKEATLVGKWEEYMGDTDCGPCPVCEKNQIKKSMFEWGHIVSKKMGGSSLPHNAVPLCSQCNKEMGAACLWDYARFFHPQSDIFSRQTNWNCCKLGIPPSEGVARKRKHGVE
jgi:hypothetical protein